MVIRGPHRPDLLRAESLASILAYSARRRPNHAALIWNERVVSYGELHTASEAMAAALRQQGVGSGQIVGLWLPRGADLLIAQAGITYSGAAWLPFDADTPIERVEQCLQLAGASGIVTCQAWRERFSSSTVPVWTSEELLKTGFAHPTIRVAPYALPDDPAYVIFTSGSTGQPKGIAISQRSICHFLRSENSLLGINEDDRVYQGFSVAFDMSFEEVWIAYLVGATLCLAPAETVGDPGSIERMVSRNGISVIHAVPTLMGLIHDPLPSVRMINLGGEACPESLIARLTRPGRELFNTYGPTEATVSATLAKLMPGEPVTIGSPLPNYGILVLDEAGQLLPAGECGELAICGPGLAIGYLGQPALTAEKFIENPHRLNEYDAKLYLTGDLGHITPQGTIHYLGRADGQVKIRGFRVELGEIENALSKLSHVSAAAVVMRSLDGIDHLTAFVVTQANTLPSAEMRKTLAATLPPYMIPTHYEQVTELPRLISGKVNRHALRSLPITIAHQPAMNESTAAQSIEEQILFSALQKLFPGQAFHADLDFFNDLGGHSLLVALLVSELRSHPQYERLGIQDIYRARRLGEIVAMMRLQHRAVATPTWTPVPTWRRTLCGIAQTLVLPFLVVLHIGDWLLPFFVYHYFTGDEGDSIPRAACYSLITFLLAEVAMFVIAIVGKWLILGRLRAGRYRLWGWTYFRFWLADKIAELPPVASISGTPFLVWYLRALGAKIGKDVLIDSVDLQAPDLLTIGDGVSLGTAVHIENARVERGEFIVGPVTIGCDSVIDSYTVIEENTSLGANSKLGGLSALTAGRSIPVGEIWEGSPARRAERSPHYMPPRPVVSLTRRFILGAFFLVASAGVAALFFMPVFPSFILIDYIDAQGWDVYENEEHPLFAFLFFFILGIPASAILILATILLAAALRWLFLGRQKPGLFPVHSSDYCRKWLMSRVLDSSLGVLHGLYASIFAGTWLRLMGATVGRGSEVSTAVGIVPDLLNLGENSFIADAAMLGDEEQAGGWMFLYPTAIGARSFIGNGAYVANGAQVPNDVLIGVQTRTPATDQLASGQTWMGSPPIQLPARECTQGFPEHLTFNPGWSRRIGRAIVEIMRMVLPLAFVVASGYLIVHVVMPYAGEEQWVYTFIALAIAGSVYGFTSFLLVLILKWTLIGRYQPRAEPMWTRFVWFSEAVTNVYESLAVPNFLVFLRGTPMLPWALRCLGSKLGQGIYLDTTDITEFDCVSIGDHSELNNWCGPQTHLFEDRVMKIGSVTIGSQVTIGACSTILYITHLGDYVHLGPLTLVAKGETLPAHTQWQGSPATSCDE